MSFAINFSGKVIQLDLAGSIDLSSTASFKEEFEQVMSSDIASVRVNAQALDYIDSSGVASLLFIRKLCTRFGASLVFESISAPAARVIQLANLDTVLGLPKAVSSSPQVAAPQNSANRTAEPKFSDADAMAIFQNDSPTPPSGGSSKDVEASTFEIKPPSFS